MEHAAGKNLSADASALLWGKFQRYKTAISDSEKKKRRYVTFFLHRMI